MSMASPLHCLKKAEKEQPNHLRTREQEQR